MVYTGIPGARTSLGWATVYPKRWRELMTAEAGQQPVDKELINLCMIRGTGKYTNGLRLQPAFEHQGCGSAINIAGVATCDRAVAEEQDIRIAAQEGKALNALASLLGGVYYPITVLPDWLQLLSRLVPVTYALRAMRLALLQGAPFAELIPDILALAFFAVLFLPLSLVAFRYAVQRARVDGSLTHY